MIVYGTKATRLKAEYVFDPCPNCHKTDSVQISVFQRYAHVFWIPFFPIGKTGISVCNDCRQVLKLDQMPPPLRFSYQNVKLHTRIPAWHFTGVFLIIAGIIALTISEKQKDEKIARLIRSPKKDDVFEIKLKDDEYTLYKVQKIDKDTVFFIASKFSTNQETGLPDLADKEFNAEIAFGLPKAALAEMNKKEEIIDIDRK